jgi:hypothetical protein
MMPPLYIFIPSRLQRLHLSLHERAAAAAAAAASAEPHLIMRAAEARF